MLNTTMAIRWMTKDDFSSVLAIEKQSFESPLSDIEFRDWLSMDGVVGLIYESRGMIAGYLVYLFSDSHYYLLNLAVNPCFRFQGVASDLIEHLKCGLASKGGRMKRAYILVRTTIDNEPAVKLFLKNGFVKRREQEMRVSAGKSKMAVLFKYTLKD